MRNDSEAQATNVAASLGALERRHAGDVALEVTSAVAGLAPWIGGPISSVLSGISEDRKFSRVKEALQALTAEQERPRSALAEDYVKTDEFADMLEAALRQTMAEGSSEKREALRKLLVNVIRDPRLDDGNLPYHIHALSELTVDQQRVIEALGAAPGASSDTETHLGTLKARLPGFDVQKVLDLIEELNERGLTRIKHPGIMTGKGSPDLSGYLTKRGRSIAALILGSPSLSNQSTGDRALSSEHVLAWTQALGRLLELDPLFGIPGEALNADFIIEEVTSVDVRLKKQSNDEQVRLPLFALSPPWGPTPPGKLRASVVHGRLAFDQRMMRWRWNAADGSATHAT